MCFFHMGIARKGGGNVRAYQDILGPFFPTLSGRGCRDLPGWFRALFSRLPVLPFSIQRDTTWYPSPLKPVYASDEKRIGGSSDASHTQTAKMATLTVWKSVYILLIIDSANLYCYRAESKPKGGRAR